MKGYVRIYSASGYGLVVKRVLAKDESGVRFSLSAPKDKRPHKGRLSRYMWKTGDKGVSSGDKGQISKERLLQKSVNYQANISFF